jgi:hypothetical protein
MLRRGDSSEDSKDGGLSEHVGRWVGITGLSRVARSGLYSGGWEGSWNE